MDTLEYKKNEQEIKQVVIPLYQEPEVSIPIPQVESSHSNTNYTFLNFIPRFIKNPFK